MVNTAVCKTAIRRFESDSRLKIYTMKEQEQKPTREKWGRRALYGGVIAGVIGLAIFPEIVLPSFAFAASGVIFEFSSKNRKKSN